MSDRVLRSRVRNGPTSVSLSEDREKVKYGTSRRQKAHKDVTMQNLRNTVAQERFKHDQAGQQQVFKKRVVFSSKRHTSDEMSNGFLSPPRLADDMSPVVGILKQTTASPVAEPQAAAVDAMASTPRVPRARGRPRAATTGVRGVGGAAARSGRVSKHASFTEEAKTSPWRSASACILEALALSVSPLARKRAKQAEEVALEEEEVRRAVSFYKGSGEWWNVFPKTDFSYSPFSRYHREISPGVPTLPNMSRPGLHHIHPVSHTTVTKSHITPSRLNYSDSFCSDSDEVDDRRSAFKRNLIHQQEQTSSWVRVKSTLSTFIMSILTFLMTTVKTLYTSISQRRKVPPVRRAQQYYTYPHAHQQEGLVSRIQTQISKSSTWIYQNIFNEVWSTSSTRSTFPSNQVSRKSKFLRLIPFLLLLLLIGFAAWWMWGDSTLVPQKTAENSEPSSSWIWNILTFPLGMIQSIFSSVFYGFTVPFSLLPSLEGVTAVLYDIVTAPWHLLVSIGQALVSFMWSIISLFLAPIFSLKNTSGEAPTEYLTKDSESAIYLSSESQSDTIRALINAALQQQEATILSKMSKSEEGIRAEVLSKITTSEEKLRVELTTREGHGQLLNAKIASLQNELRRWKRRYLTCCRASDPLSSASFKERLHDELKQLFSSPEGLVLLGAIAAHLTPTDKAPTEIPQFNDTEIRLWISSNFLDKDDFERKMANITKYFNGELERRNAALMGASLDEINARIANESQNYLAQMSKLRAELSTSYQLHNDHLEAGSRFSGQSISGWDESRVRLIVQSALALYDADKTGMADYALESQGGQVISTRCTETYQVKSPTLSVFGVPLWYPSNSPRTVIQPGMHPGECWAFVGSQGYLVIQLSHRIRVQGFTYEHISPVLLPTGKMDSAPKEFSVHGLRGEGDHNPILLGNYHYLQNSTSMQYFAVQRAGVEPLQLIEIQVKSNHGNINYTCMYRIRVHGSIA